MVSLSVDAAVELINEIREENGGLSLEDREATRPSVLKALANVRRKLGAATKTLATNLYSKDTRFVYELIQNAEDNEYKRAESADHKLYLSFNLYPDRIVLESNEDGFTEAHVRAICSTGESTKASSKGYIGEKGIGFKSVFKVAKKVHIQSGPFSFSFEHTRDSEDDGLGMVTPLNEKHTDLPDNVHTRITLTLLDPSKFEQRLHDLLNIPDTLLLFLTKLNVLQINIYPEAGIATEIEYQRVIGQDEGMESIWKETTIAGSSTEAKKSFYVMRSDFSNLPHDLARKHTNEATVVLAFPVDDDNIPVIEQQHVFAFLPLRLAGFTFLIQSDFITQASREDVFHSTRNKALLRNVAKTFRNAVLQFCDHPLLQYKWMRYLPSDSISDEFWKELRPEIISLLRIEPCLRSWSGASLYVPTKLAKIPEFFKDLDGEPLFADLGDEIYLSPRYRLLDFTLLAPLGTSKISFSQIIKRVMVDLQKSNSKLKDMNTDDDWHTRTAKLLSIPFEHGGYSHLIDSVKSLELVPVQNLWISAKSRPVYLPSTGDIPIPADLEIWLVRSTAVTNAARKNLFFHIGVTEADPASIVSKINARYIAHPRVSLESSISHLRYLFWNLPKKELVLDKNISLVDQNAETVFRTDFSKKYIYFEEKREEYGAHQLLKQLKHKGELVEFTGFDVRFLHAMYLGAVNLTSRHHGRSWKLWLEEFAGVQRFPQILNLSRSEISDEFKHIALWRPEKLIGLLKQHWSFYEPQMIPGVLRHLRSTCVPTDGGGETNLHRTFLSLPKLKSIVKRLHISIFPFVTMPREITDEDEDQWQFLKLFNVKGSGDSDKLYFYFEALKRIAAENHFECSPNVSEALFEVYNAIERNCTSPSQVADNWVYWEKNKLIYIPPRMGKAAIWVNSNDCVWSAPEWLEGKQRLNGVADFSKREHLFRVILKIGDAGWTHYLEDLKILKEQSSERPYRVLQIYQRLWREFEHDSNWKALRTSFEKSQLVFIPGENTWHPLSSCIWSDNKSRIPNKVPISTPYSTLEDFFVRILGVPKPNLAMHVQALKELAKNRAPLASEIKNMMMLISSMNPTAEDLADLQTSNIFLVRLVNGQKSFTNKSADFAIVDRSEYGEAFAGKIRVLDFSIEEVRRCRPLLLALDLERHHLSVLVEENTMVQHGTMNLQLSQAFQSKAYALFRCAVHYNSTKSQDGDKSLYDLLLQASIYVSDGISKSISLVQYGETVTIENGKSNFHLAMNGDELRLYVPREESSREECFFRQLPRGIMSFFAISDPTAEAVLNAVIGCRSLTAVDGILKDAGIIKVGGIERPEIPDLGIPQSASDEIILESTESQSSRFGISTPSSTAGTVHSISDVAERHEIVQSGSQRLNNQRSASSTPSIRPISPRRDSIVPPPLVDRPLQNPGYVALLERVINGAERMTIPARGNNALDGLQGDILLGDFVFGTIFGARSMERDRLVGAAGELFTFELLLKLQLPDFTIGNWKSTIRKEVRVHEKYRNLEHWSGTETADITYADTRGSLTRLLIEKGYLDHETWANQRPMYYLEVKTTTKECKEQFYMSGAQYRRMQRMRLQPQIAAPEIYVIFRVFNLEGRLGVRVFVDPESSRVNEELDFTVDTWAVKTTGNVINN